MNDDFVEVESPNFNSEINHAPIANKLTQKQPKEKKKNNNCR